ncbi:MAG: ATP-dependent zinc metalloprotease FtsH [Gemmatimonadales bacterium]|nr:ATP-dependent zinc metalloprotease FtsH [Gemmatimonadales bacterium]
MIESFRRELTRWRTTRAAWVGPLAIAIVLAGGVLGMRWWRSLPPAAPVVTYSTFLDRLDQGAVAALTVVPGGEIRGTWERAIGGAAAGTEFRVVYPTFEVTPVLERAERAGTPVTLERDSPTDGGFLRQVALVLVVLGVLIFVMRRQIGGGSEMGRMGAAARSRSSFADVAGHEGTVAELREVVEFLRTPDSFRAVGARTPKGVLMFGPPGTGKTLMARAVAGEAGVPFFAISGSEVTGFLIGLGVARIKKLFREARRRGGVIFIDELDALGGRRGRNQSHNEDDRTLNQLLVEMDGFSPREHVLVIGATNRQEALDAALLRPGRFDRAVAVGLPTASEREAILRLHVRQRGVPMAGDVDLARLARLMPQTSGADLANLVNESAIAAARERCSEVRWAHVEQARDRLLLGKERTGFRATDDEWRAVAIHEAGHALAGVLFHAEDGLHKVTIQPRGQAMGVAHFSPGELVLHTRRYLEGQICKGLGGRAAEEVIFGAEAVTSGAKADLQHTTRVAREMVYKLGMGITTGLVAFDDRESGGAVSAELHAAMDRDVRSIVEQLYVRVRDALDRNRTALDGLAEALLDRETIEGAEVLAIFDSHGVVPHDLPRRRAVDPPPLRGSRRPIQGSA